MPIKKEPKPKKPCTGEGCKGTALSGYRYCMRCLAYVKASMGRSGYLKDDPGQYRNRS